MHRRSPWRAWVPQPRPRPRRAARSGSAAHWPRAACFWAVDAWSRNHGCLAWSRVGSRCLVPLPAPRPSQARARGNTPGLPSSEEQIACQPSHQGIGRLRYIRTTLVSPEQSARPRTLGHTRSCGGPGVALTAAASRVRQSCGAGPRMDHQRPCSREPLVGEGERPGVYTLHHAHVTWYPCPERGEAFLEACVPAVMTLGLCTAALLECHVV